MIPLKDSVRTSRRPVLTVALIAVNLLVFVWAINAPDQVLRSTDGRAVLVPGFDAVTAEYGFVPCELVSDCPLGSNVVDLPPPIEVRDVPVELTLVTSMFMHGGWPHLLGNMLFLWIFGNNIEDRVGRRWFLAFYLLGGLAATALQFAFDPSSAVPNIGASGAIAAVLGGYLRLYPRASVITLIGWIPLPLPAMFFLVIWFAMQVASAGSGLVQVGADAGGVAYFAHIGGFLFGLASIGWWAGRNPRRTRGPARLG